MLDNMLKRSDGRSWTFMDSENGFQIKTNVPHIIILYSVQIIHKLGNGSEKILHIFLIRFRFL